MAERGRETLRHGPMKPMGLTNAHKPDEKPYAVVQLRQDNALGTLFNMVGFQTKLKYGAQKDIFRMIPGLAERGIRAARRPAPQHLHQFACPARSDTFRSTPGPGCASPARSRAARAMSRVPAIGLLAGRFAAAERLGEPVDLPPATTAFGALLGHITGGHLLSDEEPGSRSFQPMNINFGLFPPLEAGAIRKPEGAKRFRGKDKALAKKRAVSARALADCAAWLGRRSASQAAE